jgi:hypothetical protein
MSRLRNGTIAIAVLFLAAPLTAQTVTSPPDTTAIASPVVTSTPPTPVLINSVAAASVPAWVNARSMEQVSATKFVAVRASETGSTPRNKALMAVGGAGLLVGAVIGGKPGTLLMGASGIIGLIGLWNYLN